MAVKELTRGNPYKLILLFMLPIFIGNAFQQMYMLVDSLIVGRFIGQNALAAVETGVKQVIITLATAIDGQSGTIIR